MPRCGYTIASNIVRHWEFLKCSCQGVDLLAEGGRGERDLFIASAGPGAAAEHRSDAQPCAMSFSLHTYMYEESR